MPQTGAPSSEIARIALNLHAYYFVKEQHIYGYKCKVNISLSYCQT